MKTRRAWGRAFRILVLICLVLGLWVGSTAAGDTEKRDTPLRFVQITDTHLGEKGNLERLARVVERINELPFPVDFVVHSGDVFADCIADPGVRKQGLRILQRLEPPLYTTPGNHDILSDDLRRTRRAWSEAFSGLIHTKRVQGVRLVFAYTYPLLGSFQVPGYEPLTSLGKALDRDSGDRPVIVVHHAPSIVELVDGSRRGGWSRARKREWLRLLSRERVIAVLAGHFHREELHWLGEVPLYVAPPVANPQGASAFRVYEYSDGRLSYRTMHVPLPESEAK